MKVRRLTETGIQRFKRFLELVAMGESPPYPAELLEDDEDAQVLQPPIHVESRTFDDRFTVAVYLDEKLTSPELVGIEGDSGVWAWLSLFYFEQICSTDRNGNLKPGEVARWIPDNDNFRKYYRHLLRGPLSIYRAHKDDPNRALALLCGPIKEPGDVVEQLAARQELVTNRAVIQVATTLYVDSATKKLRRGAAGRSGGSVRRLADILNQFDVTWDLYGMNANALIALLPKEFDRFKAVKL
jgi:hypothetical protein